MLDAEKDRVKLLVARLYDLGPDAPSEMHDLLIDAAATLDSYQAGLIPTTPHPLTGFALVRTAGEPAVLMQEAA